MTGPSYTTPPTPPLDPAVQRLLLGASGEDDGGEGYFVKADGTLWYRAVDGGSAVQVSGGGSIPYALGKRASVVFDHADVGYNDGSGFALFDTGVTLAAGEELLLWYVHVPEAWAAAGHTGTEFTFGGYLGPTGEGDSLNNGGVQDGAGDNVATQSNLTEVIDASVVPGYAGFISAETIKVDTPVFGYISGPNAVPTAGKVQYVFIVAAAA